MKKGKKLTDKQQRFVEEYLKDLNATGAAERAAYSDPAYGRQLIAFPNVAEAIAKAKKDRAEKVGVEQEDVVRELMLLGFSDMEDFATWGPEGVDLLSSEGLDEQASRCVSEVSQTITRDGGTIRLKLHSKTEALKLLGQHLGIFTKNLNISTADIPFLVFAPEGSGEEEPEE
jgi:phage terminase small subunit